MASQVLSGTGNVTYTNNTGQNVRVIVNYCSVSGGSQSSFLVSWGGGASASAQAFAFGRSLATAYVSVTGTAGAVSTQNILPVGNGSAALPTEIMLSSGQTFSITTSNSSYPVSSYNIVVIPEAG
jgi:hypothetical protein